MHPRTTSGKAMKVTVRIGRERSAPQAQECALVFDVAEHENPIDDMHRRPSRQQTRAASLVAWSRPIAAQTRSRATITFIIRGFTGVLRAAP